VLVVVLELVLVDELVELLVLVVELDVDVEVVDVEVEVVIAAHHHLELVASYIQ
jgi:hypothetical protein